MNDMTAAWPRSRRDLESADHDGDQHPGVTSYSAMGPDYANPRVDILDATQRAERIFLGLRNIIGFSGTLTSCDSAEGVASLVLEQRARCIREQSVAPCADDLLDSNLPALESNHHLPSSVLVPAPPAPIFAPSSEEDSGSRRPRRKPRMTNSGLDDVKQRPRAAQRTPCAGSSFIVGQL